MHPTYRTFAEMLSDQNKRNPDHVAIITSEYEEKITITYHELYLRVMELASRYRRENCSCVGIYANASAQWIITMYAAVLAGKRTVLFDVLFPPEEMIELARFCGVDSLYATNREGRKIFGEYMTELRAAQLQESGNTDSGETAQISPEEIEEGGKLLFFTSGTSSRHKAVVLSQEALLTCAWGGQQTAQATGEDLVLSMLPMWHVFGFVTGILWPMTIGARIALSRGIRHALQDPMLFEPDYIPVVPAFLKYMLSMDALNKNLGTILIGGSPCDEATFRALFRRGIRVMHGYGLTETCSGIAVSTDPDHIYAMGPCPGTSWRIARDGEIILRTPSLMDGYYHDPDATARKIVDGELHTGDLGHVDSKGRLIVLGKKDEVIILTNGEKVFCPDWEAQLNALIGSETALYSVDGETLTLAVVTRHKSREEIWEQVEEFNKRQPGNKQIRAISLRVRPFPRTAQGELQRWKIQTGAED